MSSNLRRLEPGSLFELRMYTSTQKTAKNKVLNSPRNPSKSFLTKLSVPIVNRMSVLYGYAK